MLLKKAGLSLLSVPAGSDVLNISLYAGHGRQLLLMKKPVEDMRRRFEISWNYLKQK